jgi:hypothetical protein
VKRQINRTYRVTSPLIALCALTLVACGSSSSGDGSTSTTNTETAWSGTKQVGVAGVSTEAFAVAVDSSDYVYTAGATSGTLGGQTLAGTQDAFVAKYNRSGTVLWTRLLGDAASATVAYGVTKDSTDHVIIAGSTEGSLSGALIGTLDFFVAKYDSSGTRVWVAQLGASGQSTVAYGVATDSSNNIYVVGQTDGDLDGNTLIGTVDFFIAKFNSSGARQWTKTLGDASPSTTSATAVAVDSSGNPYVAGSTDNTLDGNALTGTKDLFLTKYNSSGVKQWTKQLGAAAALTAAQGVAIDGSSNIYVGGKTTGFLDGNTLDGNADVFVTKYSSAGTKIWTRQVGALNVTVNATAIAVDTVGNAYVTGDVDGNLDGNTISGLNDLFVTKYSTTGIRRWTTTLGGGSLSRALSRGIALDSQTNIFVSGRADEAIDGQTAIGSSDYFVSKFNSSGVKQ